MNKLQLLIKTYNNNLKYMRELWINFLDASSSTEFTNKSTMYRDLVEGRAADNLWFIMTKEYDKVREEWKKEWWKLYNSCCSYKASDEVYKVPTNFVGKNTEEEQIEFFIKTTEFFERWIDKLKELTTQHSIIVKSTLHTLDMALLTKG